MISRDEKTNRIAYLRGLIDKLASEKNLTDEEFAELIQTPYSQETDRLLAMAADQVRKQYYGTEVYVRGLIEFTNYCKNNCYYCGIRAGNSCAKRYRLSKEQILQCCQEGYALGFRTFVLQGGEDPYYTDERICEIVRAMHQDFPDCAITLSIGEKSREAYAAYKKEGVIRYLLRHETADEVHYRKLHPESMSLTNRKRCLWDLKELGYQVGAGFMVGSPYQTTANLISDLRFLQELQPDMIGIGPFIHHADTPFKDKPNGTLELSLRMLAILRLCFPYALLPATTALATIAPQGRELGLQAGGNVVMPNLSPGEVREMYQLYAKKLCTGSEAAQAIEALRYRIKQAGYELVVARGDVKRELKA